MYRRAIEWPKVRLRRYVLMKSNTTSGGRTATVILTFLVLFGLVLFIFIRYGLVAAIGFAAAIILGRKAVKYIIAKGTNQTGRRRDNTSQINDAT